MISSSFVFLFFFSFSPCGSSGSSWGKRSDTNIIPPFLKLLLYCKQKKTAHFDHFLTFYPINSYISKKPDCVLCVLRGFLAVYLNQKSPAIIFKRWTCGLLRKTNSSLIIILSKHKYRLPSTLKFTALILVCWEVIIIPQCAKTLKACSSYFFYFFATIYLAATSST